LQKKRLVALDLKRAAAWSKEHRSMTGDELLQRKAVVNTGSMTGRGRAK
jgi:hypothetical protein